MSQTTGPQSGGAGKFLGFGSQTTQKLANRRGLQVG
jgi:hypothetical protein